MPIVTVSMYSGRTQREKDRLAEAMTEDISNILNVKCNGVYLFVFFLKILYAPKNPQK